MKRSAYDDWIARGNRPPEPIGDSTSHARAGRARIREVPEKRSALQDWLERRGAEVDAGSPIPVVCHD